MPVVVLFSGRTCGTDGALPPGAATRPGARTTREAILWPAPNSEDLGKSPRIPMALGALWTPGHV